MIDLKTVISKYPDSISNGKRLKSILLDLYPDEKLYVSLLAQILDDGIVDEIKAKKEIDVIEFINLCNKIEKSHGIAQKYIEGCLTIWANAFDIPIKTKLTPVTLAEQYFNKALTVDNNNTIAKMKLTSLNARRQQQEQTINKEDILLFLKCLGGVVGVAIVLMLLLRSCF